MKEFGFELRLCAHLEQRTDSIIARQLGGGITESGRVLDVVLIDQGPSFEQRASLTDRAIPTAVLEADIGPGRFKDWRRELGQGIGARRAIEHAIDIGYLEFDNTAGRERVRSVDRYPVDWFERIIAIENKPDLDKPGDLYEQLQFDISLGLVDEVVLTTASHVTRAHLNRLPDVVGIWRFNPGGDEIEIIRTATPLPIESPGMETINRLPGRTEVENIDPETKAAARIRLAERAYGKGWRTFTFPACANLDPASGPVEGMPYCEHFDRFVNPAAECGPNCPDHRSGPPPAVNLDAIRDRQSPWQAAPPRRQSRQMHLGDGW